MRKSYTYEPIQTDTPGNIARYAKASIFIIWIGGLLCLTGIISLMLAGHNPYITVDSKNGQISNHPTTDQWETTDSTHRMFENKTALVNVGLRNSTGNLEVEVLQPNGSIQISKIFHDQKLQAQKSADPSFVIKAVPK